MHSSDGTGGCDGCLNWKGVGARVPNNNDPADRYQFTPANETDNNGLENLVMALEKIYTNIDWPFEVTPLTIQSGIHVEEFSSGSELVGQPPAAGQVQS